jgi:hypothetical protein
MTRLEKLASWYLSIFGEEPSASKLHEYAGMNDFIPLEVISSLMVSDSGKLDNFNSMDSSLYVMEMFQSVFNLSTEQMNQIISTNEGLEGFQYWVNELENNPFVTLSTLPIALINGTADTSSLEESTTSIIDNYNLYYNIETEDSLILSVSNEATSSNYDSSKPLDDIPYTDVSFLFDSQLVNLELDLSTVDDYDDMWNAIVDAAYNDDNFYFALAMVLGSVTLTREEDAQTIYSLDGEARSVDQYIFSSSEHDLTISSSNGWNINSGASELSFNGSLEVASPSYLGRTISDIESDNNSATLMGIDESTDALLL